MRKIFIIGSIQVSVEGKLTVYLQDSYSPGCWWCDTLSIMLCHYDQQLSQKGFIAMCTCISQSVVDCKLYESVLGCSWVCSKNLAWNIYDVKQTCQSPRKLQSWRVLLSYTKNDSYFNWIISFAQRLIVLNVQFQKISILSPQKGLEFPGGWGLGKAKKIKEMYEV